MNPHAALEIKRQGNKILMWISIQFSVFWIGTFLYMLSDAILSGTILFIMIPFFMAGAIVPLVIGLRQSYTETIRIKNGLVTFEKHGLLRKRTNWSASLSDYRHLLNSFYYGGSKRKVKYFDTRLIHDDPSKCVLLETTTDPVRQRSQSEKYSREMELLVHEKDFEGKVTVKRPEDSQKTINELEAEGKIKRTFLADKHLSGSKEWIRNGCHYKETPSGFQLVRTFKNAIYWSAGLVLISVLIFLASGAVNAWAIVFFVAGIFAFLSSFTREEFEIDRTHVHHLTRTFGIFTQNQLRIPVDKIEEIKISQDHSRGTVKKYFMAVSVASDDGTIYMGHNLAAEEKEWLVDKLLSLTTGKTVY